MSLKRGRDEEDNYIHEPRKKFKPSNNEGEQRTLVTRSEDSQLFNITELVENILKYLIWNPKAVFSIATVSRRHNEIVHSKAFWTRMGFTDRLSKTAVIAPPVLLKLLVGLRRMHIKRKYAKQMAILEDNDVKRDYYIRDEEFSINLSEVEFDAIEAVIEHFLTERTLTTEAYLMISKIREISGYVPDMADLVEMIAISEDQIQYQSETLEYTDQGRCFNQKYPKDLYNANDYDDYHVLLKVDDPNRGELCFSVLKKYLDKDRSVVFLVSYYRTTIHFISINKKTNMIECCGDLFTAALDPHSWTEDLSLDQINEIIMDKISALLATKVFRWDKIHKNLAQQELACMQASQFFGQRRPGRIMRMASKEEDQYYWENIPLYRNK